MLFNLKSILIIGSFLLSTFAGGAERNQDSVVQEDINIQALIELENQQLTNQTAFQLPGLPIVEKQNQALAIAIESYWQNWLMADHMKCYSFYCDSYKKTIPIKDFLMQKTLTISQIKIISLQEKDNLIVVKFEAVATHDVFEFNKFPFAQKWMLEDEQWRIYKIPPDIRKNLPF